PSFSPANADSIDTRLAELERKMDVLLGRSRAASSDTVTVTTEQPSAEAAPSQAPLQQVSVSGGYQKTSERETRLPVSGYMEAHFNKAEGEPGRADFHRFVLLFGHSFSERIKFWSELEVEHALLEGGEERGELALEQAYLDFLVKPSLNFR